MGKYCLVCSNILVIALKFVVLSKPASSRVLPIR
jgi:hypothetical protein